MHVLASQSIIEGAACKTIYIIFQQPIQEPQDSAEGVSK